MGMQFELISPANSVQENSAVSISFITPNGAIQILNNHAPMLAEITEPKVCVKTIEKERTFLVKGAFVTVENNKITILAAEYEE